MSNQGQSLNSSKASNIVSQSASSAFHPANLDSSSQRRPGGSGSFGAGLTSKDISSPRSNQARKSQHKKHRRPRLLDDEEYSEAAAMRSTTSRKGQMSITHLMNFSLPPRPEHQPSVQRSARRYAPWGYHAMDKARYVHANYRFIVAPNRSYYAQAANADVYLDWDSVLQVLASAMTQAAYCPICLSVPVAPRMARCGHIFCLPCLIRYIHTTDDDRPSNEKKARWKTCPVCWDTVYTAETRPVRWFRGQEGELPIEGGDVVLRLIKRELGCTLALPRDGAEGVESWEDVPWHHAAEVADYARIMKGGEDYMNAQHDAEIEDLRRQAAEDELLFGDDKTWPERAIAAILNAKERIRGIGNPPDILLQPVSKQSLNEATQTERCESSVGSAPSLTGRDFAPILNTSDDASRLLNAVDSIQLKSAVTKFKQSEAGADKPQYPHGRQISDQPYYFYQALPQFYLSFLDIRILKAAFGDYSSFPATILPRVEHISTGHIVDDEFRKRVKYLGHLPHGCEVSFLECDWTDVVSPEILQLFQSEIQKRRKRNKEKEMREEKARIRAEKEEDDKRWAAVRRKRSSFPSGEPPFSDMDFQPLVAGTLTDPPPLETGLPPASPPETLGFGAFAPLSTSPLSYRTVWGTTAVHSLSQPEELHKAPAVNDGWKHGWEEELMAQQESEAIALSAAEGSHAAPSGKKKRNKKITLMSTSIQRGA